MQYGREATITSETASLTPEEYREHLTVLNDEARRPVTEVMARAATAAADFEHSMRKVEAAFAAPFQPRVLHPLRQVLIPGKRKAARHPWADRLEAARTGGFVVDQTHPDTNLIVASCYGCGDRFGFYYGDTTGQALFEERVKRHQPGPITGIRECARGVTA